MNQQIDNALGGYEESVIDLVGELKQIRCYRCYQTTVYPARQSEVVCGQCSAILKDVIKHRDDAPDGCSWVTESVCTLGGEQGNCLANAGSAAAPDTLLEQIKELRPKVTGGYWHVGHISETMDAADIEADTGEIIAEYVAMHNTSLVCLAPAMADLCIIQAARIEELEEHLREIMNVSETSQLQYKQYKIAQDALRENKS